MKSVPIIFAKLLAKGAALFMLSALTIFNCIFKVFLVVYHLISVALSLICVGIAAFDYFTGGWTEQSTYALLLGIVIVALRFVMPMMLPVLQNTADHLKDFVFAPIHIHYTKVKSPVRYTM